jgi:hypothetical protein
MSTEIYNASYYLTLPEGEATPGTLAKIAVAADIAEKET